MRRCVSLLLACVVLGCAEPEKPVPTRRLSFEDAAVAPVTSKAERCDVSVEDADLREVCALIAHRFSKRKIVVAPDVHETVTCRLCNLGLGQTLRAIARLARCDLEERGDGFALTQPPAIELDAGDIDAPVWLAFLAGLSGKNCVVAPDVSGKLDVHLTRVRPGDAIDAIARANGWTVRESPDTLEVAADPATPRVPPAAARARPAAPSLTSASELAEIDAAYMTVRTAARDGMGADLGRALKAFTRKIAATSPAGVAEARAWLRVARSEFRSAPTQLDRIEAAIAEGCGARLLGSLERARNNGLWTDEAALSKELENLANGLRGNGHDVLVRKGESLLARWRTATDGASTIAAVVSSQHPRVLGTFVAPLQLNRAIVAFGPNDPGQTLEDGDRPMPGLSVAEIAPGEVTFHAWNVPFTPRVARPSPAAAAFEPSLCEAPDEIAAVASAVTPAFETRAIDVSVEEADLREVLDILGRRVGRTILLAPGVHKGVTIHLRAAPWRDAVAAIAKLCRCEVEEQDGVVWVTHPTRISLDVTAPAGEVLERIALASGENVVFPCGLAELVTVHFEDANWLRALSTVARAAKLEVELRGGIFVVKRRVP